MKPVATHPITRSEPLGMLCDLVTPDARWSKTPLRIVNLLAFVPLMVLNGWAGSGGLSGESIGVVANRWPTLLLPASWTFGIWSLIYLALAGFVVYQALPRPGAREAAARIGPVWLVTVVLNVGWLTAFSFSRFALALAVMAALLVSLIVVFIRLDVGGRPVGTVERLLVQAPFSLYLGWITVAFIVNTAQYLEYLGWDGAPLNPVAWTVIMMAVATVIGALFDLLRREWIVPLVVAWALVGIGARYADRPVVATVAWVLAGVSLVVPVVLRLRASGFASAQHPQDAVR